MTDSLPLPEKRGRTACEQLRQTYLTVEEVAQVLHKSPKTIYRYLRQGLPHFKFQRTILIHRRELERWIENQRVRRR